MSLQAKLQNIYSFCNVEKKVNTFRKAYKDLLNELGNPERNLPQTIHVAGTNGKGSVIALLKSILLDSGYHIDCYTSPHLVRFNERIVLDNKEIEDSHLEALIDQLLQIGVSKKLSFFEFTTALAFLAFSKSDSDYLLLETGIGGRLDCTNVISSPAISIITNISKDHTDILGNQIKQIAFEKAGIIKKNVPCIIGPSSGDDAIKVFQERAEELNSELFFTNNITLPCAPQLNGNHQIENAKTALKTLEVLKPSKTTLDNITNGLQNVHWPGRLQKINTEILNNNWDIWIDGGHNQAAGKMLSEEIQTWKKNDTKKLHLIIGSMERKKYGDFLSEILPYTDSITAVPIEDIKDSVAPNKIINTETVKSFKNDVYTADSIEKALQNLNDNYKDGRILITGSLYLIGNVLKYFK
jgi:dihydrofolate synthase/folylpolyglutamate synthase